MMALMVRQCNYLFDVCLIAQLLRRVRVPSNLAKSGGGGPKNACRFAAPWWSANFIQKSRDALFRAQALLKL
jgi:hypothetical protein